MSESAYDELYTLLDSLTDGERIKVTWAQGEHLTTVEGPVLVYGLYCECGKVIRRGDGTVNGSLTTVEVIRTGEVTVTRDDEDALYALLDSLEDGVTVTAEWRNLNGPMTLVGPFQTRNRLREVRGYYNKALCWGDNGELHAELHSVTVRRHVVKRWERDGDE